MLIHYKGYHSKFDEWISRACADLPKDPAVACASGASDKGGGEDGRNANGVCGTSDSTRGGIVESRVEPEQSHRIRSFGRHKKLNKGANERSGTGTGSALPSAVSSRMVQPLRRHRWRVPGLPSKLLCSETEQMGDGPQNRLSLGPETRRSETLTHDKENYPRYPGGEGDEDTVNEAEDGVELGRRRRISELSQQYGHYIRALAANGLGVVPVSGDGNCLFR